MHEVLLFSHYIYLPLVEELEAMSCEERLTIFGMSNLEKRQPHCSLQCPEERNEEGGAELFWGQTEHKRMA